MPERKPRRSCVDAPTSAPSSLLRESAGATRPEPLSPPWCSNTIPAWPRRRSPAMWPLLGATIIHRHGRLVPGDNIVLVVTAASHRGDAFAAAEFLMDYLKTSAPFWKKIERPDGAAWVDAKSTDDAAAGRWTERRPAAE